MFSIILSVVWAFLYLRSPYLFPSVVAPLYFFGLQTNETNILMTFPLRIFYFTHELRSGQNPKYQTILNLELIRWIFVYFFDTYYYPLACYSFVTLITTILEFMGKDEKVQIETKYRFYLVWTVWMIFRLCFQPFNMIIALFIHIIGFIIDFRVLASS